MFDSVNKAIWSAVEAAGAQRTLAEELMTLFPVEDWGDVPALMSHLIVVRAYLRQNPPWSKRLIMALHNLIREVEQLDKVVDNIEVRQPRYGVA
jgi:hypothetical protein